MKYEKYKTLEDKFENTDFNASYKPINLTLYIFSLFGNVASVFFAYFFLFSILAESVGALAAASILGAASIFFLSLFELLKRYVFHRFSLELVAGKFKFAKETIYLGIIGTLLITLSFYMSLNGAHKFSDKGAVITEKTDSLYIAYSDSLNKKYNILIQDLKIENKDLSTKNEQYNQEAEIAKYTSIKKEKFELIKLNNDNIKVNKEKIQKYETDLNIELSTKKLELETKSSNQKEENSASGFKFVMLSSFIELFILIGIFFNNYYSHRSYREYAENMMDDNNFQSWKKYNSFIDIIYKNGKKTLRPGDEAIPVSKVQDMARIKGLHTSEREVSDAYKVFNHLRITALKNSRRFITSDYELAKEVLKRHYNVK